MKDLLTGDLGELAHRPDDRRHPGRRPGRSPCKLALIAIVVAIIFGVTAGVVAGIRRGSIFDNSTLVLTLVVLGIPIFVLAPLAQYLFGVKWQLFPPTAGADPTLLRAAAAGASCSARCRWPPSLRLTRASVAENLRADYVRTARCQGPAQAAGRRRARAAQLADPGGHLPRRRPRRPDGRRDRHRGHLQHPRRRLPALPRHPHRGRPDWSSAS